MQLVIGFHSLPSLHSQIGMGKTGNSILGNDRKKDSLATPIFFLPKYSIIQMNETPAKVEILRDACVQKVQQLFLLTFKPY